MADCSNCERKKAAAPELTSEQQTFLLALESKDARYHKLIRWIVSAFIFCMLMMSAIFAVVTAWDATRPEAATATATANTLRRPSAR